MNMPITRIATDLNNGTYFITFSVFRSLYVLDRFNRWNILSNSLQYCIKNKSLKLEAFVFMINHIHLIVTSNDVSGFVRDFKKFTSKKLKENIIENEKYLLRQIINHQGEFQFWQHKNAPRYIESEWFFHQKLEYIHNNPVVKEYVMREEDWYWSSANHNCEIEVDRSNW